MIKQMFFFVTMVACFVSPAFAKFALLVGVSQYEHPRLNDPQLRFPEEDARAIGELLKASGYEVQILIGKQATRQAIRNALANIAKQGNRDDVLVLGFFGHGVQYGESAYFCPYDTDLRVVKDANSNTLRDEAGVLRQEPDPAKMVSMRDMLDTLTISKAGSKLLLADCCREDPSRARGGLRGRAFGEGLQGNQLPVNSAALFACSAGQQAFEHDEWKHGAFTRAFLDVCATRNEVTANELFVLLYRRVNELISAKPSMGSKQTVSNVTRDLVDLKFDRNRDLKTAVPAKRPLNETLKILAHLKEQGCVFDEAITLLPGDKAPELPNLKFLEGEPVEKFEKGNVYVINTFASWCGPCLNSLPILHELQLNYPQVTFMEVAVGGKEDAEKLYQIPLKQPTKSSKSFQSWWKGKVGYRFCFDPSHDGGSFNGLFWKNWGQASGKTGIPVVFIVDQLGRIAWIGHPWKESDFGSSKLDNTLLDSILSGTWDTDATRANYLIEGALSSFWGKYRGMVSKKDKDAAKRSVMLLEDVVSKTTHTVLLSDILVNKKRILIDTELSRDFESQEVFANAVNNLFAEFESDPQACDRICDRLHGKHVWKPMDAQVLKNAFQKLEAVISKCDRKTKMECFVTLAKLADALEKPADSKSYQSKALQLAETEVDRVRLQETFAELEKKSK